MTPLIVLQEGTWSRCCGLAKHLEDKRGGRSAIQFSVLSARAQVVWSVCGQQSEWRAAKVTHGRSREDRRQCLAAAVGPVPCRVFARRIGSGRIAFASMSMKGLKLCDGASGRGLTRRSRARARRENRLDSIGKTLNLRPRDKMSVKHPPTIRDKSCLPVGVPGSRAYSPPPPLGVGTPDVVLVG
jgi:hypothetical protein